jgi:hypothetical protein
VPGFEVSRSTYYDWLKRPESNRKKLRIKVVLEKREIKVGKK